MLKFYLNRELSTRLGIPLSRWKRWSREFLPPDPLGGHQSGYARQYSLKDAFYVYLAGYLVSEIGYSIPEARQILFDLNGWLKKDIIEQHDAAGGHNQSVANGGMRTDLLIMPAKRRKAPAFTYRIRSLVDRKQHRDGDAILWQEQYTEQVVKPGELIDSGSYPACARWVDMSALVGHFFIRMTSKDI